MRCGQNPAATCEPVNSRSVGAAPAQTADQPVNSGGTTPAATYQLPNPIGTTDVTVLLGRVVRAFLGVLGSLALFWFVWGGILWMTAEQSEQRVKDAQTIMKNATLGLVIIFFSYGLTTLFLSVVQEVAAPASTQQGRTLGGESPITNNTPR